MTSNSKLFRFLNEAVKPEILGAIELSQGSRAAGSAVAASLAASLVGADGEELQVAFERLKDTNAPVRAEALLLIRQSAISDRLLSLCFDRAFDDPDSCSRGAAWLIVGELWRAGKHSHVLLELTRDAVRSRFRVFAPKATEKMVSRLWLDGIAMVVDSTLHKRRCKEYQDRLTERWADSDRQAIESSPSAAAQFLDHSEPGRRVAALWTIARAGTRASSLAGRVREMLADPEVGVKTTAIVAFSRLHAATQDPKAERLLAKIVMDKSQPVQARFEAYEGLHIVHGLPSSDWPTVKAALRSANFLAQICQGTWPDDSVDWAFVERCAN